MIEGHKKRELGEIPAEWNLCSLMDFVDSKNDIVAGPFGSNLKVIDYKTHGVPIIRLQNIERNKFINENIKFISQEKAYELKYHSYKANDIVLAKLGDPIGKTCIIPEHVKSGIVVADVVRIRPSPEKTDARFLEYALNSDFCSKQMNGSFIGTTRPRVNLDQIRYLKLLKPPLKEQQKIASILSNVDELIQKIDQIIQQTQRLKKALINSLVTKGEVLDIKDIKIPQNHILYKLNEIVSINPRYKLDNSKEYPFVEMAALNEKTKTIDYFGNRKPSSGYAVFKNQDTLFARITPCTENGKICLVSGLTDIGIGSTEFVVLSPNDKIQLLPEFLYFYCQTDKVRNYAISQMRGATGRQRVPDTVFTNDLFIILPSTEIQKQSIQIIKQFERLLKIYRTEKMEIENLKKGLMQQLLTGKIRVKV